MENLIRKLAWQYARQAFNNGINLDFEELQAEANLAYLEALRSYDESKGKITTYVWHCVSGKLKNYLAEEIKHSSIPIDEIEKGESNYPYFEKLSRDGIAIAEIILSAPVDFANMTKKDVIDKVTLNLSAKGISFKKIWRGIEELSRVYA